MNINQKIQFYKNRRHMDALRIKRLRRRVSDGFISRFFNEAKQLSKGIAEKYYRSGSMAKDVNYYLQGLEKAYAKGDMKRVKDLAVSAEFECNKALREIKDHADPAEINEVSKLLARLKEIKMDLM